MIICFKTEASEHLGYGHLRRCLILADVLKEKGMFCRFITADSDMVAVIRKAGFEVAPEPADCENIVIDLFHRDYRSNPQALTAFLKTLGSKKIIFIDGLFEDSYRDTDAPYFLACVQPYPGAEQDIKPHAEHWLAGAQYMMMDPHFSDLPRKDIVPHAKNLLLAFGGADPQGLTAAVMEAVDGASFDVRVIVGPYFTNEYKQYIREIGGNCTLIEGENNMVPHYQWADLAACSSGQMRFECAAAGVPCVFSALYPYHEKLSAVYAQSGAARYLGRYDTLDAQDWRGALCDLRDNVTARREMAAAGQKMLDGKGVERLAEKMIEILHGT